jgi:hypothetical protein
MNRTSRDSGFCGGVIFRYASTSRYYFACVKPGSGNGWLKLCVNTTNADSGRTIASGLSVDTAFTLTVGLSRDTFSFSIDSAVMGSTTDSMNRNGRVGYGYGKAYYPLYACFDSISWTDANAGNNLALNRPAYSSSNESCYLAPCKAVDGNSSTRWSSQFNDPQWIYVDLGQVFSVNRVVFYWETAYGKNYKIQVSNNASSWTDVYTRTNGPGGTETLDFTATPARYVRMYGTARGTCWGYSLYEFKIYGTGAPANNAPTDIQLSRNDVDENLPAGTVVGLLSTTDADLPQSHTYSLVSGQGSDDNASFSINGDSLKTAAILDYETKNSLRIRVRTTDNGMGNLTYEKNFLVIVNGVNGEDYKTWNFSRKIVLNTSASGANVSGTAAKFPVLLRLTKNNFPDFNKILPGGADIRFSRNDTIHLKYEIERWVDDPANDDTADIWVLVDTIYGDNSSQYISMYYGRDGITTKSYAKNVFDTANGFAGVWKLNDDPGASSPQIHDATYNELSGTSGGSMTSSDLAPGMIGKAIHFDGADDRLNFGNGSKVDITGHNSLTFSAWVKFNAMISSTRYDIMKKGDHQYGIQKINATDNKVQFVIYDGTYRIARSNNDVDTSSWYYFSGVYNGSNDSVFLYVNGVKQSTAAKASNGVSSSRNDALELGRCSEDHDFYFPGKIDQAVLSRTARSADWIKLCYENQRTAQTLVSFQDTSSFLDSDNDGVPNIVEAAIGENVTSSDLAIPDKWINTPDSDQVVHYNFSNFTGYSEFTSVPLTIPAGVNGALYNPIIRIVDTLSPAQPILPNHVAIGKFDVLMKVTNGPATSLSFPFPIKSGYEELQHEYFLLQHYIADSSKWEIRDSVTIASNVAYFNVYHNFLYSLEAPNINDTIRYVDSSATGTGDGKTWANAFKELRTALDTFATLEPFLGDLYPHLDFFVAKGTYKPTDGTNRRTTFKLIHQSKLYGGFPSHGSSFAQRNSDAYKTILSGDIGVPGDNSDNCYTVARAYWAKVAVDGFTITGGNNNGFTPDTIDDGMPDHASYQGSGLDIWQAQGIKVSSCVFTDNYGDMGAFRCGVSHHVAFLSDTVRLRNCIFINNKGNDGGPSGQAASFNYNLSFQVENCVFTENNGIGVYANNWGSSGIINCVLSKNNGSAIAINGQSGQEIGQWNFAPPLILNCTIYGNKSPGFGGGLISRNNSYLNMRNCIFWNDTADSGRAEIYFGNYTSGDNIRLQYCDIHGGASGPNCTWSNGYTDDGGNINAEPLFADAANPAGPDLLFATRDDGLRLKAGSPCMDTCPATGAPETDILGVARPWGRKVDMGAYEYFAPVTVLSPLNDTLVNSRQITVRYTNNGVEYDSIVTLTSDTNRIIISGLDALGQMQSDTEIIRLDIIPPVIVFTNPSKDTAVSTSPLHIYYTVDGAAHDTLVALTPALNAVTISARDEAGNSSMAKLRILYSTTTSVYAWAQAPQAAFTYQAIFLDARVIQKLLPFPTKIRWRQIGGYDYVCIADSTSALASVLTRGADNLVFQLEVMDSAGVLSPAFDTVHVTVTEPTNLFDYLQLLTYNKYGSDNNEQITVTSPGMDASYYTTQDSIELAGTVTNVTAADTIYWHVKPGTNSGHFVPQGKDWSGLKVPVNNGDNLITLIYSRDSSRHVSADHILVSKGTAVSFGELLTNPETFWIDSLINFTMRMKATGTGVSSVRLLQISAGGITDVGTMYDNGTYGDSIAYDGIYSNILSMVPEKDSVYYFRVDATANGQHELSAVYTFLPQVPYSPALVHQIFQINDSAASQYFSLKGTIGQDLAMDSVANWLYNQPTVAMAGVGPGGKALCWEFECGVHAMISDAPEGRKGTVRNKAKGIAPYLWFFRSGDELYPNMSYDILRNDTNLFNAEPGLVNDDYQKHDVSLEDWMNWHPYKTIIVSTHGNTFGYGDSLHNIRWPKQDSLRFWTAFDKPFICLESYVPADTTLRFDVRFHDTLFPTHWKDFTVTKDGIPNIVLSKDTGGTYYALTPRFFSQYDTGLINSLIYISACRSLYQGRMSQWGSLWNAFHSNGASAMLGYTDYTRIGFAAMMGWVVYDRLERGDTLKHALDTALSFCKEHIGEPKEFFNVFSDSLPADTSISLLASRLKMEGDKNFVFESFYEINLNGFDTTQCQLFSYMASLKSFYPGVPVDSTIFVTASDRARIPLMQCDKYLQTGGGDSVGIFKMPAHDIHAKYIYACVNARFAPYVLKDSVIGFLNAYFHRDSLRVTVRNNFILYRNIRDECNYDYSINCLIDHGYYPTDTLNWTNVKTMGVDSAVFGAGTAYLDVVRFPMPDSVNGYVLDSLGICCRASAQAFCPEGPEGAAGGYVFTENLRVYAITIKQ